MAGPEAPGSLVLAVAGRRFQQEGRDLCTPLIPGGLGQSKQAGLAKLEVTWSWCLVRQMPLSKAGGKITGDVNLTFELFIHHGPTIDVGIGINQVVDDLGGIWSLSSRVMSLPR